LHYLGEQEHPLGLSGDLTEVGEPLGDVAESAGALTVAVDECVRVPQQQPVLSLQRVRIRRDLVDPRVVRRRVQSRLCSVATESDVSQSVVSNSIQ
jgi:hypothetical protein